MSSLQEQLLKAGLVDRRKLAEANREKNRKDKQRRNSKGRNKAAPDAHRQARADKARRDRELESKRRQAAQQKELSAQAKQLLDEHKQDRSGGEIPYSFVYRKKVKKIFVTESQKNLLSEGKLVITTWVSNEGRRFELVPAAAGEKIAQRDSDFIVTRATQPDPGDAADDPYADYRVPDDLVW